VTRFDQIEYACLTDVGVRRSHNQDNHAVQISWDEAQWQERGHLFLVADGMGAHAVGEKASEQAAQIIPHTYHKHAQQGPAFALHKAFVEANGSIHAFGQANREFQGTGTTSTALLLRPEGAWIGHVGDSRVYRIRSGVIEQLSYDHSLIWEYARLQKVDPEDVEDIPSNVIHRCLGPEAGVEPDVEGPHSIRGGDIFLLCSDGLSGQVSDAEIGAIASVLPTAEACRFLVDLANMRGGPDNITVLIVRITPGEEEEAAASEPDQPRRRIPWWVGTLTAGILLAILAVWLQLNRVPGKIVAFLLAVVSILSGLVGLGLAYHREQNSSAGDEPGGPPRIHRRASCAVSTVLLDKLTKALQSLCQHAEEKRWEVDHQTYEEHRIQAEKRLGAKDLPGAFREYCRAMLPLTQALHQHRNKEEVFQPLWDKTR
jgi:serine/threonine protein phosphatase PrpC